MTASSVKKQQDYQGFEQGPIRPPSEARSLLIRVTRNCPWNRCTFCPVYKGDRFSLRPVAHVIQDIDAVHRFVSHLRQRAGTGGYIGREEIYAVGKNLDGGDLQAFHAAVNWMAGGMTSVFLQDANSLIIKPKDLVAILLHLRNRFPWVERITSYARSHTVARIADRDMKELADAGLNRIHIGLESGSDTVLQMVQKGASKEQHIKAGRKVKTAGMELSEYVMPGLGGREHSELHARETADALNHIDPDFIRLRSLAIPNSVPLYADFAEGRFEKCTDGMMVREILLFLESLSGIASTIKSDHILNLFEEVQGTLPDDRDKMLAPLKKFLEMSPERQMLYQVGRRVGMLSRLGDLDSPQAVQKVQGVCDRLGITPDNADEMIDELMKRFI